MYVNSISNQPNYKNTSFGIRYTIPINKSSDVVNGLNDFFVSQVKRNKVSGTDFAEVAQNIKNSALETLNNLYKSINSHNIKHFADEEAIINKVDIVAKSPENAQGISLLSKNVEAQNRIIDNQIKNQPEDLYIVISKDNGQRRGFRICGNHSENEAQINVKSKEDVFTLLAQQVTR